jgi:DnaJ-class molecular chaperone
MAIFGDGYVIRTIDGEERRVELEQGEEWCHICRGRGVVYPWRGRYQEATCWRCQGTGKIKSAEVVSDEPR